MKNKTIKLTESDLVKLIKRVIKEQSFASGSDDPGNEVFEEYYEMINQMYEEIGGIDNLDDLEYMKDNFYGLAQSISRDEDLNDDEAEELIDLCGDALKFLEDMEYDFDNDDM